MGDFPGHMYPGIMFLVWGTVWCLALRSRGGAALARPWDPHPDPVLAADPAAHAPWESWLKLLLPLLPTVGDLRWVSLPITDASVTNYQHIAGYAAVSLAGLADLLTARKVLPPGTDRLALALCFLLPAFFFAAHGHHFPVATAAHQLLALSLFWIGVLVLAEHLRPAPLFRWLRIYLVLLTGAWFVQTGWMLYRAGYDLMSEELVTRVYLFYTWYVLGLAVLLAGGLARRRA